MEKPDRDGLRKKLFCLFCALPLIGLVAYGVKPLSQQPQGDRAQGDRAQGDRAQGDRVERFQRMSKDAENRGLADPFKGVTTDGNIVPGLFHISSSGVSTEPVR